MMFPDWLTAAVLGLIEGATEFLPVSSTGHLIIAADYLGYTGDGAKVFEIFIQLGAILAVMWFYRHKLTSVVVGLPRERSAQKFTLNLIVAFIPAAVIGLLTHTFIKEHLFNPIFVAVALILGGFIILLVERFAPAPRIHHVDDMSAMDAFKVGVAQCFALIPGTSRSGSTIMGGMMFGLSRTTATEFSFFLAIPTMIAATLFDLIKHWHMLHPEDMHMMIIGFVAAFISGLAFVSMLLHYISKHTFKGFAYYRIAFGVLVLWYFWT
ncbi:MAG: undecaprenyl-diphosphate phosphatase [Halothiobacillus sp.]